MGPLLWCFSCLKVCVEGLWAFARACSDHLLFPEVAPLLHSPLNPLYIHLMTLGSQTLFIVLFLVQIHFVKRFNFMCIFVSLYHMYTGAGRGQKRALDALELELQLVMSCYIGAGN